MATYQLISSTQDTRWFQRITNSSHKSKTVEVNMLEVNSEAGSPLRIPVRIDGLYLDTGAGVVVLGGGWLSKRTEAGLPEEYLSRLHSSSRVSKSMIIRRLTQLLF